MGVGMTFYNDSNEHLWLDCDVPGCTNKACDVIDSKSCFPHTPGNEHVKRLKIAVSRIMAGFDEY